MLTCAFDFLTTLGLTRHWAQLRGWGSYNPALLGEKRCFAEVSSSVKYSKLYIFCFEIK